MEKRYGYRSIQNIGEVMMFLFSYFVFWLAPLMGLWKSPSVEELIQFIFALFLMQGLLLPALYMIRHFRHEFVLTEEKLSYRCPGIVIEMRLEDIVSIDDAPHIMGAGCSIKSKHSEVSYFARLKNARELHDLVSKIIIENNVRARESGRRK